MEPLRRPNGSTEEELPTTLRKFIVKLEEVTSVRTPCLGSQRQKQQQQQHQQHHEQQQQQQFGGSPKSEPWPQVKVVGLEGRAHPPVVIKQEPVDMFGEEEEMEEEMEAKETRWSERPGHGCDDGADAGTNAAVDTVKQEVSWGEWVEPPCLVGEVVKEEDVGTDVDVKEVKLVKEEKVEEVEVDVEQEEEDMEKEADGEQLKNHEECGSDDDDAVGEVHIEVRRVSCPLCGRQFLCRSVLQNHLDWKHAPKIKKHQCPLCPYSTNHKANMHIHQRIHTGEKPFKCTLCDKAFTQAGHLHKHRMTHLRRKPFECVLCGRGYSRLGNLKRHQVVHSS